VETRRSWTSMFGISTNRDQIRWSGLRPRHKRVDFRLFITIVTFTLSSAQFCLSLKRPLAAPQSRERASRDQILRKLQWWSFSEIDYSPSHKHRDKNTTIKQVSDIKQLFHPISEPISLTTARNHQNVRLYLCRCNTETHVETPLKYCKFWQNWS
jgi:hypothetical protein